MPSWGRRRMRSDSNSATRPARRQQCSGPGTPPCSAGAARPRCSSNELTLPPLVLPLAPAKTPLTRLPDALAELPSAHRVPAPLIEAEHVEALEHRLAPTTNRSLVGVMNEFAFLADLHRAEQPDLMRLSMRLATTPCGPLFRRHISPDRELAALLVELPAHRTTGPAI